jgi:hypothetical protein
MLVFTRISRRDDGEYTGLLISFFFKCSNERSLPVNEQQSGSAAHVPLELPGFTYVVDKKAL